MPESNDFAMQKREKSISDLKHEVQKLEDWSKGHDEVF